MRVTGQDTAQFKLPDSLTQCTVVARHATDSDFLASLLACLCGEAVIQAGKNQKAESIGKVGLLPRRRDSQRA